MAQIWTSAPTAVKAKERRWGPLGLIPTEPWHDEHSSALMCSALQARVADLCPVGSVLPLSLWGKLFPNPPAETSKLLGKGLQGKRKNCAMWHFGSTHWLLLLQNVSRRQSVQLCGFGNGLSALLPSSQQHFWAQRTEEAGAASALGEQQPRDRDMTAKSSCVPD